MHYQYYDIASPQAILARILPGYEFLFTTGKGVEKRGRGAQRGRFHSVTV